MDAGRLVIEPPHGALIPPPDGHAPSPLVPGANGPALYFASLCARAFDDEGVFFDGELATEPDAATIATAGLGLGLRVVRGICKACGWRFDGRGTHDDFRTLIHFDPTPPNRMANDTLTKQTL
jgi:hypothetical protein